LKYEIVNAASPNYFALVTRHAMRCRPLRCLVTSTAS
jgi:hypothetical protein